MAQDAPLQTKRLSQSATPLNLTSLLEAPYFNGPQSYDRPTDNPRT
jgi:hypothetical protein